MSEGPQGAGWWQASDLKWYPPAQGSAESAHQLPPTCSNGHQNPDGRPFCGDCGAAVVTSTQSIATPTQLSAVTKRPLTIVWRVLGVTEDDNRNACGIDSIRAAGANSFNSDNFVRGCINALRADPPPTGIG
jgi:hypothetical protein